MKALLERLVAGDSLEELEARSILHEIIDGAVPPAQLAAFLTLLRTRALTLGELGGYRAAVLERSIPLRLEGYDPVDLCGTGGDGKETFNISTAAAFVVAGAGVKVAKHGNYGLSSFCGSSNVLEELGVPLTSNQEALERDLERAGICFLHAPLFHPGLRAVSSVRKELGIRTFFNTLGPLVNPCRPSRQMMGVSDRETLRLYTYLLQRTETKFVLVHTHGGYDEISLTAPWEVATSEGTVTWRAEALGLREVDPSLLAGGSSRAEYARILVDVISGKGPQEKEDVVVANAAFALVAAGTHPDPVNCLEVARESIRSGRAARALAELQRGAETRGGVR